MVSLGLIKVRPFREPDPHLTPTLSPPSEGAERENHLAAGGGFEKSGLS